MHPSASLPGICQADASEERLSWLCSVSYMTMQVEKPPKIVQKYTKIEESKASKESKGSKGSKG